MSAFGDRPDAQDGDVDPFRQQGRRIKRRFRFIGEAEESRGDRRVDDHGVLEDRRYRVGLRSVGIGAGAGGAQQQHGQGGT